MDWLLDFYNYRIVGQYLPLFAKGVWATLWMSFVCLVLSMFFGTLMAFMRMSRHAILWRPAAAYTQVIRATPLLIQIYLVYYGLPAIGSWGQMVGEVETGILALTLHTTPYMAEIIRAGIESVSRGQSEAAMAVGMNQPQKMFYVVLPQAFANITPPLLGQMAILVKDTSLLSIIAVFEVMGAGITLMSEMIAPTESFVTTAICYLSIYAILVVFSHFVRQHLGGAAWQSS